MAKDTKTAAAPAAAADKVQDVPKATYLVLSLLDHDGERYPAGSEVELTDKQAAPLLGHTVEAKAAK